MKQIRKDKIVERIKSLPVMSSTVSELLRLIDDPEATAFQAEEVLRRDPNMTLDILKLTNSPYFGLPCRVGSVKQAVVLLGWKRLRQLVMISCLGCMLGKPIPGYDLPAGELWRHSIAVSVSAEGLAKEINLSQAEEAFTAGLVHDLGKQVLGMLVKEETSKIEEVLSKGVSFVEAERKVLGTDHAEIGALILKKWNFPEEMIRVVRWHHEPDRSEVKEELVDIVHIANILCLMIGIGVGREGIRYNLSTEALKRLGIKTAHLERVASQTKEWVDELTKNIREL